MANTEGVDLSRLQQHAPLLHLSLVDLMQYVSVGTSELLHYLLKETHVILECRACFNLFRGVPYLIAHKRFYCKQKGDYSLHNYGNSQGPPHGDLAAFFQAESPLNEKDFLKYSVELAKKNLQNTQVQGYLRKEPTKKQFYEAVQKQLELSSDTSTPSKSYSFEPLENTEVAVKVVSSEEAPTKKESSECGGCAHSKDSNSADKTDAQNGSKGDSSGSGKFNRSASSSSISSMSSSSYTSDNKNEGSGLKLTLRNTTSEYRTVHCFKCNATMPSQKAMSDHMQTVHPTDNRSGHTCGDSNHTASSMDPSQQKLNGMQNNKVRKTDWLKPKSYTSTIEKIPQKPSTIVNTAAKEALEVKKKNQANLQALKEEQMAYENEILQQKLIRGIIPKSSRGRKKFRCESCGKIFSKMDSLRDHLRDCIDWEHVSQPIRNLKLPLPAVSDVSMPSLPMSAPASVDLPDTGSEEPPKPPTPAPQFRPLLPKTENRVNIVPPKSSTAHPQDRLPVKLRIINGINQNLVENPTRGQVLVLNPQIKENPVTLLPLSNASAASKSSNPNPKTPSPVEIFPKPTRTSDPTIVKPQLLAAHLRTNHNPGSIMVRNQQTVIPVNRGAFMGPVGNEVKDVEIIAVNPANNTDKPLAGLQNKQSTIINMNVAPTSNQVNSVPCNCLQCESGGVNSDNPVNDSSRPIPTPAGCRDCAECQKSTICSSACCVKDIEIVEQFTSLPPEGSSGKFSMSNYSYQQKVPPTNDSDDVIITSHSFARPGSIHNTPPVIITAKEKGFLNLQNSKVSPANPNVLVTFSNQKSQIPESQINMQISPYPVPMTTTTTMKPDVKITNCRSYIKPVIWKQFKCKFCIFSHKSFVGCKLHLKWKHAQKIRTCDMQCINHYIVDLKCRKKKLLCCSLPSKNCRRLQNHRLNPLSSLGSASSLQKSTPQVSNSTRTSAPNTTSGKTLSRSDKKDPTEIMDTKNLQCLECKHTFQNVYNLQRHVVRHFGKKDFQCKVCSRQLYTLSECRSHIKKKHLGKVKGITLKTLDRSVINLKNSKNPSESPKNCATNSSSSVLPSVPIETNSNVAALKLLPKVAAQLSVLSTRKSNYQKKALYLDTKTKPTKKIIKK